MPYAILEEEEKFKVVESRGLGKEDLILDVCETKAQADRCVRQWEARDALQARAQDHLQSFVIQAYTDFEELLEPEEINEIIRDAV